MENYDATTFPIIVIGIIFINRYFLGVLVKKITYSPADPNSKIEPNITIVLPLYNEGPSIYKTLMSLADLDYPSEKVRIIVMDDCSTDDSYAWAQKAMEQVKSITVIRNPVNMGKRLSISRAVQMTDSEFIVSVDSDVVVRPNAIRHLISGFDSPQVAAVGGRVHVLNSQFNWLTKMQAIKYFIGYEYLKNLENAFLSVMCLSGCLTMYRKSVLLELEPILLNRSLFGIPIKYGEDRFLTRQILKSGYRTKLVMEAECYTKAPTTLAVYFSQQLRWRRSNCVDFFGGITHVWRLDFLVAMHYFAMQCILLAYPVYVWALFINGRLYQGIALHCGILAICGFFYYAGARKVLPELRVNPVYVLALSVMLPLTYMVISVVALFTLDAGSWETRNTQVAK